MTVKTVKTRAWTADDFAAFHEAAAQIRADRESGELVKKTSPKSEAQIIAEERRREIRGERRYCRRNEH